MIRLKNNFRKSDKWKSKNIRIVKLTVFKEVTVSDTVNL